MSESGVNVVAEHYNKRIGSDLQTRTHSRIFYMRNFNNWIKSVLINEFIKKIKSEKLGEKIAVLDLGCGKGGDILKWKKANAARVTFADIAEKSLEECKNRYQDRRRSNFDAQFIHLDATQELISQKIEPAFLEHHLVSSQFVVHYSFESYAKANTFLRNVSDSLKPGGFFIGTTTNSSELIKRLRASSGNEFGNELYKVKFKLEDKNEIALFGVQFDFELSEVVECPEFLINFQVLERLAQKHGLELVLKKTFSEFFEEHSKDSDYRKLVSIMQALEPFYSNNIDRRESADFDSTEYEHAIELLEKQGETLDARDLYATLSKSEWEAITLYMVFAFRKLHSKQESKNHE